MHSKNTSQDPRRLSHIVNTEIKLQRESHYITVLLLQNEEQLLFNQKSMDSSRTKGLAQRLGSHFLCSQYRTSCLATQSGALCQPTIGCTSILSVLSALSSRLQHRSCALKRNLLLHSLSCFSFTSLQSPLRGKFNH